MSAQHINYDSAHIAICNCPFFHASLIGNKLVAHALADNVFDDTANLAVMWYEDKDSNIRLSFRSNASDPDVVDCSAIAKLFKGGGHQNSSGGMISEEEQMDDSWEDIFYQRLRNFFPE